MYKLSRKYTTGYPWWWQTWEKYINELNLTKDDIKALDELVEPYYADICAKNEALKIYHHENVIETNTILMFCSRQDQKKKEVWQHALWFGTVLHDMKVLTGKEYLPNLVKQSTFSYQQQNIVYKNTYQTHETYNMLRRELKQDYQAMRLQEALVPFDLKCELENWMCEDYCSLEYRYDSYCERYTLKIDRNIVDVLTRENVDCTTDIAAYDNEKMGPIIWCMKENRGLVFGTPVYYGFIGHTHHPPKLNNIIPIFDLYYKITVEEVSDHFARRSLKHFKVDTDIVLLIEFRPVLTQHKNSECYQIHQSLLLSRYVFLRPTKNVDESRVRSLPFCMHGYHCIYNNSYYRVQKAKTIVHRKNLVLKKFQFPEHEEELLDEDVSVAQKVEKKMINFHASYYKRSVPVIYITYDVETRPDEENEHKVFMLCCECFVYDQEDYESTNYEVVKKTFCVNPTQYGAELGQKMVVTEFLRFVVDLVQSDLSGRSVSEWKELLIQSKSNNLNQNDSLFYLQVRICGYNSSNYDDKFLLPYLKEILKPHHRDFSKRGQTINKHIISGCSVFKEHAPHVKISFVDIIRFLPEISSLKVACETLEIPIPKIEFNIVKYSSACSESTFSHNVDLRQLFSYFDFDINEMLWSGNKVPRPILNQMKKKFEVIFSGTEFVYPDGNSIYKARYDLFKIVEYYCQRDVTATQMIIKIILFRFRQVLTNMFNVKVYINESVKVENTELTFFDIVKPLYKDSTVVDNEQECPMITTSKELMKVPLEKTTFVDIMEYMSIAQISYFFIKHLMIANRFCRLNTRLVDQIKFIKTSYFGGLVHVGLIGLYENTDVEMLDVKSEYPLCMTAPLPLFNDHFTFKNIDIHDENVTYLQEKIDNCKFFRDQFFADRKLHEFKPHKYINFLGVFFCQLTVPKPTQASVFACLPFPEHLTHDTRSCRYFTVSQKRVITTHHICALILQGWTVDILPCEYNILFNCEVNYDGQSKKEDKKKTKRHDRINDSNPFDLVTNDQFDFCYLKQFVTMFGEAKALSADEGNKVDKKLYKMILNTGAGRLGMKDVSYMTTVDYEFNENLEDVYHENTKQNITSFGRSNFELAVFINSAALYVITRAQYLLQLSEIYPDNIPLWKREPTVLYTDTDSILFCKSKVLPEVYETFKISNDIGYWENNRFLDTWSVKSRCNAVLILAKKSYVLLNQDKQGLKEVAIHSKGVPVREVAKEFFENGYIKRDLVMQLLESGSTSLSFGGILRKAVDTDYSMKTFVNHTYTKKINVARLGFDDQLDRAIYNYEFLPKIPSQFDYLNFVHHPCEYIDCDYCAKWYFFVSQSLEHYNFRFDRLI
jgi:hypothetical protein